MKNILIPVEAHTFDYPVIETALLLGRMFDSYIEGLAMGPSTRFVPTDVAFGGAVVVDKDDRQQRGHAAHRHFTTLMRANEVPEAGSEVQGLHFGWRSGEVEDDLFLGRHARVFDCIVLGRPSRAQDGPRLSSIEAVLFEGGRPVLIVPPSPASSLAQTAVIAWNRSTETARTVGFALPLLRRAAQVVVVEVEGWGVTGPSGPQLSRWLRQHAIEAEALIIPAQDGGPGATVLSYAGSLGCDLLVKGAYTQSRIRQMIFGGATSHILAHSTVPVLMAH